MPEAAASWYDLVYLPIAEAVAYHRVLDRLPHWTAADAYVEITRRWPRLSEDLVAAGPDEAALELLRDETRLWWHRRRHLRLRRVI